MALWGMLSQNIQRQLKISTIAPPYTGPSIDPASAAAPTTPSAKGRRSGGTSEVASAMPIGTVAPPPTACTTRAPTIQPRLPETATSPVPIQKTTNEAMYTRG